MLLSHERFQGFAPGRPVADAQTATGMLIAISQESRAGVDAVIAKAEAAGGRADPNPRQEVGDFMYGRSFQSPDGHIWEVMWMDVEAAMAPQDASATA